MRTKRFLSLILAVIIMLGISASLASCKKESGDSEGDKNEGHPDIAASDYEGYNFVFLTEDNGASKPYRITAEDETSEALSDSISKRNSVIKEKYNVTIEQKKESNLLSAVRSSILAGVVEFDAILAPSTKLSTMACENLLYALNTVERFDFEQEYWDSNSCEQLQIANRLYFANCSLNLNGFGLVMFFNKNLIEQHKLTNPYDMIENNTWTMNKWLNMIAKINTDLDQDGQRTINDRYGMLYDHSLGRAFAYASGIRATTNNENGKPVITVLDDETKFKSIYNQLGKVAEWGEWMLCEDCSIMPTSGSKQGFSNIHDYTKHLFTKDQYLFAIYDASEARNFINMDSEFGIVPLPKYDESQNGYQTLYPAHNDLLALPRIMSDPQRTFNIIEDINYCSNTILKSAWFDDMLTRKGGLDTESMKTLETLYDNRVYDVGMTFNFGGLGTEAMDVDVGKFYNTREKESNILYHYKKYQNTIQAAINNTYNTISKLK